MEINQNMINRVLLRYKYEGHVIVPLLDYFKSDLRMVKKILLFFASTAKVEHRDNIGGLRKYYLSFFGSSMGMAENGKNSVVAISGDDLFERYGIISAIRRGDFEIIPPNINRLNLIDEFKKLLSSKLDTTGELNKLSKSYVFNGTNSHRNSLLGIKLLLHKAKPSEYADIFMRCIDLSKDKKNELVYRISKYKSTNSSICLYISNVDMEPSIDGSQTLFPITTLSIIVGIGFNINLSSIEFDNNTTLNDVLNHSTIINYINQPILMWYGYVPINITPAFKNYIELMDDLRGNDKFMMERNSKLFTVIPRGSYHTMISLLYSYNKELKITTKYHIGNGGSILWKQLGSFDLFKVLFNMDYKETPLFSTGIAEDKWED